MGFPEIETEKDCEFKVFASTSLLKETSIGEDKERSISPFNGVVAKTKMIHRIPLVIIRRKMKWVIINGIYMTPKMTLVTVKKSN